MAVLYFGHILMLGNPTKLRFFVEILQLTKQIPMYVVKKKDTFSYKQLSKKVIVS